MKYKNRLELLNPGVLDKPDNDLKLLRKFVIFTILASIVLLAFSGIYSLMHDSTRLLWYFLAFILPFDFFLLSIYSYQSSIRSREWALTCLQDLADFFRSTITTTSMAIDAKEQTEYGNILKVRDVTMVLARNHPRNTELDLEGMSIAALTHDIGKLAVPEGILNKPGGLTKAEITIMRLHSDAGGDILSIVPFPDCVVRGVRYHHERWDGAGYPEGIAGEEIPLEARILSVADTYVSLRSPRPFRKAWEVSPAKNIILKEAGHAFDPTVTEVFKSHFKTIESIVSAESGTGEPIFPSKESLSTPAENAKVVSDPSKVFNDISFPHKEMQAEFEITRNVGRTLSLEETSAILTTWIERFVPYTSCVIFRSDLDHLNIKADHSAGKYKAQMQGLSLKVGEGVSGVVADDLKPRFNTSPSPDFDDPDLQKNLNDCLIVPLIFRPDDQESGESASPVLIGVISLYSKHHSFYTKKHLRLMKTISEHASRAINNSIIHSETREDAFTDSLTGLPNIRYFNASIENEIHRAERLNYPINFLMMDLDDFKAVNDAYGHKEGDRLLVKISSLLRDQFRKSDICIRYGGDEFLAILPGVGIDTAAQTMARISSVVKNTQFLSSSGEPLNVGISIGSSSYPKDGTTPEVLLITADRNMYKNKNSRKESKKN